VLSPLLSNIVLDQLDQELERRGHKFARYADDCNIYVRSRRAGERVMESVTQFITAKLKLRVNSEKGAVARPWARKFLGFSLTSTGVPKRRIAPKAVDRFKERCLRKRPVFEAILHRPGISGDKQRDTKYHGGSRKALLLIASKQLTNSARRGPLFYGVSGREPDNA
jgi:hypothetical protein